MSKSRILALAAIASAAAGCASLDGGGSIDLLRDGLAGFTPTAPADWSFAGGVLQAASGPGGPSLMVSREDFGDVDLTLEVYVSAEHNSGVFVRCSDRANVTATTCYEVNIYDHRPDQSGRTGGAPGYFTPLAHVDAGGRWSTIHIRAEGRHLLVEFNGVKTIDADGPLTGAGPIALQWGAGEVRFRNVRARRL
jgi:hypothetical protein